MVRRDWRSVVLVGVMVKRGVYKMCFLRLERLSSRTRSSPLCPALHLQQSLVLGPPRWCRLLVVSSVSIGSGPIHR